MPIATHKVTSDKKPIDNLPKIEPESYKSVVVDEKKVQLNTLVSFVEGAPWTVDYYQQIVSKNNDLKDLDPGQSAVYQQYTKINKLEIRVTSPLTSSQDANTTLVTVSGSGNIYPFLTPNVGDVFVADVLEGRRGLLRINNVERRSFDRNSIFTVEYDLVCFTDTDSDRISDLEQKVTRQFFFNKDRLVEGLNPLLVPTEYQNTNKLINSYQMLVKYYFKTFYNREFTTLILPGQECSIYDPYLVSFLLKIVDTFEAEQIRYIKNLGNEDEYFMKQDQLWSLLLQRDYDALGFVNSKMGLVRTEAFSNDPTLSVLRFSRLDYVVYPLEVDTSVNSGRYQPLQKTIAITNVIEAASAHANLGSLLKNNYIEQNKTYKIINMVLNDDFYVLSERFYLGQSDQSILESLVTDYLKLNALNVEKLLKVCETVQAWGRLEQFYYIPILILLIKTANQNLY